MGENFAPRIFGVELAEFFQQIAHTLVFGFRDHYLDFDDLVAAFSGIARRRSALFAQAQFFAAIGAGWNADLRAAVNRGDFHFRAERSFRNRDRNDGVEIVAAAFEERMRLNFYYEVEIARRAAVQAGVSASGDADARAGLRARRNAHVERFDARHAAFAVAIVADGMKASGAAAARAGDLKTHLAADLRYLAGTAAGGANFFIAGLDTGAMANIAGVQAGDAQFF